MSNSLTMSVQIYFHFFNIADTLNIYNIKLYNTCIMLQNIYISKINAVLLKFIFLTKKKNVSTNILSSTLIISISYYNDF